MSIDVLLVQVSRAVLAGAVVPVVVGLVSRAVLTGGLVFVVVRLVFEAWNVTIFTMVVSTTLMPFVESVTVLEVCSVSTANLSQPIPSVVGLVPLGAM